MAEYGGCIKAQRRSQATLHKCIDGVSQNTDEFSGAVKHSHQMVRLDSVPHASQDW